MLDVSKFYPWSVEIKKKLTFSRQALEHFLEESGKIWSSDQEPGSQAVPVEKKRFSKFPDCDHCRTMKPHVQYET